MRLVGKQRHLLGALPEKTIDFVIQIKVGEPYSSVRPKQDFPYSAEDGIFQHLKIVEYSPKIGRMRNIPVTSGIF